MEARDQQVDRLLLRAIELIYVPYIWGGNDPVKDEGLDCSGFIGYLFREIGVLPEGYDNTADGYYRKYLEQAVDDPRRGCLVFYGKENKPVTHMMLCLTPTVCVGAVRGNKWTDTVARAKQNNARVDIRSINYRADLKGYADPFEICSAG